MNFIKYYDNTISKDDCNTIIQISKNSISLDFVKHNNKGRNYYRIPSQYFWSMKQVIDSAIENSLLKYKKEYNIEEEFDYNFKVHYNPVGGYIDWHNDHGGKTESSWKRRLAFIIYLNDLDEGELQFKYFPEVKIMPVAGRCLIMPTGWTHIHKAEKLFEKKFILTGFFC